MGELNTRRTLAGLVWSITSRIRRFVRSATDGFGGGASEEIEEARTIELVRRGGSEGRRAFRLLVERHQSWLVYFLSCLLGNQSDAEDVAQEVFVRAFLSIERFREDARFKTWIRRIAVNQAYNFRRERSRSKALEAGIPDRSHDSGDFASLEARDALQIALDEIEYDDRQILLLRYVEELKVQEIASALDIGLSATKMRLKRAREDFRHAYDAEVARKSE